jgi:hypothetical protein
LNKIFYFSIDPARAMWRHSKQVGRNGHTPHGENIMSTRDTSTEVWIDGIGLMVQLTGDITEMEAALEIAARLARECGDGSNDKQDWFAPAAAGSEGARDSIETAISEALWNEGFSGLGITVAPVGHKHPSPTKAMSRVLSKATASWPREMQEDGGHVDDALTELGFTREQLAEESMQEEIAAAWDLIDKEEAAK